MPIAISREEYPPTKRNFTMRTISRRDFITTASAFAASTALIGNAGLIGNTAFGNSIENRKQRISLGIQLYSLREFSLEAALDYAKQIGFTQVEFYSKMLPIDSTPEQIADVRKKVTDRGLSISAHGVNRFTKDAAANRKLFEFAKAVGIPTITADPDPDSFANLNDLVKEFDIRVAIHNHGPKHRYNKALDVLYAVEKYDSRIGACADLGHYIRSGEKPTEVIRLLKGRLYGIHLKDFAEMQDKTKGVVLGKGHLDCQGVVDALLAVDFPANGAFSLEYEENPKDPIAEIKECFAVANAALAKANSKT
jgi:inosose dehydratase